jgi:hypothetical protein
MPLGKIRVAAVIVATIACGAVPCRAQNGSTLVAVVTADPNSSLTRRVRIELQSLGVDVIVLKPPDEGTPSRAPLEQAARSVGAIAAVRLVASSGGKVEVWVADRVTGKAVVRELDAPEGGASDAAVAVGSVELLRASLMELHSGEPPRGDAPATEGIERLALPTSERRVVPALGLGVGTGVEVGVRGLGPSLDANVGLWVRIVSRLGARFIGQAALSPSDVATRSGAIEVRSQLLGAAATYEFADVSAALVPGISLGMAATHVSAVGTAAPPFVSASQAAWYAAPVAGVGLAWSFARGLRLRGDGFAAWAIPPVHIVTPTGSAAWWGAPAITFALGVEVLWGP